MDRGFAASPVAMEQSSLLGFAQMINDLRYSVASVRVWRVYSTVVLQHKPERGTTARCVRGRFS